MIKEILHYNWYFLFSAKTMKDHMFFLEWCYYFPLILSYIVIYPSDRLFRFLSVLNKIIYIKQRYLIPTSHIQILVLLKYIREDMLYFLKTSFVFQEPHLCVLGRVMLISPFLLSIKLVLRKILEGALWFLLILKAKNCSNSCVLTIWKGGTFVNWL